MAANASGEKAPAAAALAPPWPLSRSASERAVRRVLARAEVEINGSRPWDIRVHDTRFYRRVLLSGPLGLGESYMDAWWDCDALDLCVERLLRAGVAARFSLHPAELLVALRAVILNLQTRTRSTRVAREHYDLGNDLYLAMLDPYNQYTCAYFEGTDDLDQAQVNKLDLICRKLRLGAADRVLDLGCGWGGFARFAAERYGCHVTGINISGEQVAYATAACRGMPVTIVQADYRDVRGTFDKVLVCGMLEHVGYKNYRDLMCLVRRSLRDGGLSLLHTMGRHVSGTHGDPWITKYVFPNSMPPSMAQIAQALDGLFVAEDWHAFGHHYVPTLLGWYRNFERAWGTLRARYGERFRRMWRYYLLGCAGVFRARRMQLWQVVLSKEGVPGGYAPAR